MAYVKITNGNKYNRNYHSVLEQAIACAKVLKQDVHIVLPELNDREFSINEDKIFQHQAGNSGYITREEFLALETPAAASVALYSSVTEN